MIGVPLNFCTENQKEQPSFQAARQAIQAARQAIQSKPPWIYLTMRLKPAAKEMFLFFYFSLFLFFFFFFRRDALKEQFGKEPSTVRCLAVKSALLGTIFNVLRFRKNNVLNFQKIVFGAFRRKLFGNLGKHI